MYFATESLTMLACGAVRLETILSVRVTICFFRIHFLNSALSMPRSWVASPSARSSSSSRASVRLALISMLPRCSSAARSLKICHWRSIVIPTTESAFCVARNSSASSTPGIASVASPPWLR